MKVDDLFGALVTLALLALYFFSLQKKKPKAAPQGQAEPHATPRIRRVPPTIKKAPTPITKVPISMPTASDSAYRIKTAPIVSKGKKLFQDKTSLKKYMAVQEILRGPYVDHF